MLFVAITIACVRCVEVVLVALIERLFSAPDEPPIDQTSTGCVVIRAVLSS